MGITSRMALQGLLFDINTALGIQRPQDQWPIIRAEGRYFLSDDPTYYQQKYRDQLSELPHGI